MGAWNDDDRLLIRAIREGWDVPAARKPAVIARLLELATTQIDGSRAIKAARALFAAAKLQLDATKLDMLLEERAELKSRLAALEASPDEPLHRDPPPRTDPPDGDAGDGGAAGPAPA